MVTYAYVIAGSEATGGAGIQVDLKTFHQLGVFGMGTITCVVSVDPKNDWAHRFVPLDAGLIADQIEAATSIRSLDTVKVGMLGTAATIDVVAAGLKRQAWKNVVVDPVLICKGGDLGPAREVDDQLREKILSQATVATPNYFEACTLSGLDRLETVEEMTEAARIISAQGPRYVLVKGGVDFPGPDAVDVLWDGEAAAPASHLFPTEHDEIVVLASGGGAGGAAAVFEAATVYSEPKVGHERVSGAGCTLAAAVTAELAKGAGIHDAVRVAKDVVTASIKGRVPAGTPFDWAWQGAYASA